VVLALLPVHVRMLPPVMAAIWLALLIAGVLLIVWRDE
jgi:hypothetical protein